MNVITFLLDKTEAGATVVTPCVDGIALTERVEKFETQNSFTDPAGGYGGLVPEHFNFGPLDQYFSGASYKNNAGFVSVLGCECGEVGCWPMNCEITVTDRTVTWNSFKQPFRPQRDYSSFGPFVFATELYKKALDRLVDQLVEDTKK